MNEIRRGARPAKAEATGVCVLPGNDIVFIYFLQTIFFFFVASSNWESVEFMYLSHRPEII